MKKSELAPKLQNIYQEGAPCGVEKILLPGLENLWFVVPPQPPTTLPPQMPSRILGQAMRVIEQLPHQNEIDELDHLVSHLFLRREAMQSSRMEGTWSTIDHIFTPGEIYDQGDAKSERASVLGYAHALEKEFQSVSQQKMMFSYELVCRLHKNVVKQDPHYRGIAGKIRESVVFIGGLRRKEESIYNPPPPRHVLRCLKETLDWMSNTDLIELGDAGMGIPLPVRMAIGHSHFEGVHPFNDGNGRVGRMLMTLQMSAHGVLPLYLSGFIEAEKEEYGKSLQAAQKKLNYGPIVEFICNAIIYSYQEAQDSKQILQNLPQNWASRGKFRKGSTANRMLNLMISNPIFTAKSIQELLKITKPAAHQAIAQLLKAKIIRERTGQERNQIFAAEEVLEVLARNFAEPPQMALMRAQELLDR